MVGDLTFAIDPKMPQASKRAAIAQAMMGATQMPQDVGQGIQALGRALQIRQGQRGQFPQAPGGASPSLGTMIANRLGMGSGGAY